MTRKRSSVNRDLRIMFLSFMGGYMLAKTGILDDPVLAKKIAEAILDPGSK